VAQSIAYLLQPGGCAIIVCVDDTHRYGITDFVLACHDTRQLSVSTKRASDLYHGQLLSSPICREQLHHTAGYVDTMNLLFFFVEKKHFIT
jgi:hypothetical protein